MESRTLLTTRDVAVMLGVTPETVRTYINTGALPASRPTRKLTLVREADVDAFLKRTRTAA